MDTEPLVMLDGTRHTGTAAVRETGLSVDFSVSNPDPESSWIEATVTCRSDEPVALQRAGFSLYEEAFAEDLHDWRVFIDSGTLAWNGVRRLNHLKATTRRPGPPPVDGTSKGCHRSNLQTVLWHLFGLRYGVLIGFCSQENGLNTIDVWPDRKGRSVKAVEATQEFALRPVGGKPEPAPLELQPGETIELDPLWIRHDHRPLELLEEFGRIVQDHLGTQFDEPPITGYMTWYSKTAAIDEDTVTGNLPILADLFCGYPQQQRPMLIVDHGWQQNASLGPVEADSERFPHGLPWLVEQIRAQGFEPGIWHSLTHVTEDAPNRDELIPLLATDKRGRPLRGTLNLWDAFPGQTAERKVNVPDADCEATHRWWQQQLRSLGEIGMRYFKLDFLALRTSNANRCHTHSGHLHRRAWKTFREAVPADAHLAPCSCDTNLAMGRCDSVRVSTDIGEAGKWPGNAEALRKNLSSIGALWYKHRRFWINDPDSVQLAKGCSLGEARVRATAAAFSGGHLMLSEDLRRADPARLEMVRRLLPAVPTAAVPQDLFTCAFPDESPAQWLWTVDTPMGPARALALFNLNDRSWPFHVEPRDFGIDPDSEWIVFDWWQCRWIARAGGALDIDVPPLDVAVIHARPATEQPSIVSCSHHPSGLYIVHRAEFNPETSELCGKLVTKPGLNTVVFGQMPRGWRLAPSMRSCAIANSDGCWQCEVTTTGTETPFTVQFEPPPSDAVRVP